MMGPDYGADCSTFRESDGPDLDPTFTMLAGTDVRVVAEAWARRLCTPRGGFVESPNDGFDLRRYCNAKLDRRGLFDIKVGAEREGTKDERIATASATIRWDPRTKALTVLCSGTTVAGEDFDFVVASDGITTKLVT